MKINRTDDLILPPSAKWLVLLPLAIIFVDAMLESMFAWREAAPDVTGKLASPREEAAGRTRVLAAILPFGLVALLVAANFIGEFLRLFGDQARRLLRTPLLLFGFAALLVVASQAFGFAAPEEAIGRDFVDEAFQGRTSSAGVPLTFVLDTLIWIFRLLLTLGAGAAIFGTISCLAEPSASISGERQAHYRNLQRTRLDGYLYASALLLVTGLFFIDSCFRWLAPFSTEPALYTEHVNALMLADGIFYSAIIVSYYVPVALLRQRPSADGTSSATDTAGQAPEEFPLSRLIKAFVAMLSPAVAGLLAQFIEAAGL